MPDHVPKHPIRSSAAEYLAFAAATGNGAESMEMRYEDENIWLTQKMMAALCDVSAAAVNQHLKTIFEEGELNKEAVIRYFLITASAGKQYNTNHYNLQAIIAVGFKVNNDRAVQFRKWANGIVKDDTIQGWAIDSDRLKNGGSVLTKEYFDHLLEQIRGFGCLSAGSSRRSQISMPRVGLRQVSQDNAPVLRGGAEQAPLGHPPPHSGGTDHGTGQRGKAPHGADLLGAVSG